MGPGVGAQPGGAVPKRMSDENHHDCTGPPSVSSPSPRPEPLAAGGYETSVPARPCRSGRRARLPGGPPWGGVSPLRRFVPVRQGWGWLWLSVCVCVFSGLCFPHKLCVCVCARARVCACGAAALQWPQDESYSPTNFAPTHQCTCQLTHKAIPGSLPVTTARTARPGHRPGGTATSPSLRGRSPPVACAL